jgi:NADH-quinone oxidoreductase subunit N
MYFKDGDGATEAPPSMGFKGMLVLLAALVVLLGVWPQVLLSQLQHFVYTW